MVPEMVGAQVRWFSDGFAVGGEAVHVFCGPGVCFDNVGVERFVRCRERKTSSERRELRRSRRFLTIGELWFAF